MTIEQARLQYWRAWVARYHVMNDDKSSAKSVAETLRVYLDAKRNLIRVAAA